MRRNYHAIDKQGKVGERQRTKFLIASIKGNSRQFGSIWRMCGAHQPNPSARSLPSVFRARNRREGTNLSDSDFGTESDNFRISRRARTPSPDGVDLAASRLCCSPRVPS